MTVNMRRLPVYLLLDCSESMAGSAMEAVNQGVAMLISQLKTNPQALETVFLSIIAFSSEAKQILPLTELIQVQPPRLGIRPGTALGAALRLLLASLQRDVVKTTASTKGDWRPLVFLMTDGQPTDEWEDAADAIQKMQRPKISNFYAIGCGEDVDTEVLYRITDVVLKMPDLHPEKINKFFVWLTASVQSASMSVADGRGEGKPIDIALPQEVMTVAPRGVRRMDEPPRQVFLRARCVKTKKPYLMRYAREPDGNRYIAKASHPLDDVGGGGGDLPPVDSSALLGCPPCPYCGNPCAGVCGCGAVFCNPAHPEGPVTCPQCNAQLTAGDGGGFKVKQSAG